MNFVRKYKILENVDTNYMLHFLLGFLLVTLSVLIIPVYLKRRRMKYYLNKLPTLKLRFYHVLGHVHILLQNRKHSRLSRISSHVYDFSLYSGMAYVLNKDGINFFWQMYYPFVSFFKAEAVELVLNNSSELEKAWFYKFIHPWLEEGLLTSSGNKWKSRRKLLTPAFHFNILKDFQLSFSKHSLTLVKILRQHTNEPYVNIVPFIVRCSLDSICDTILGANLESQLHPSQYEVAVQKLSNTAFERGMKPWLWTSTVFKLSPIGTVFDKHRQIVFDFATKLIKEKKKAKLESKMQNKSNDEKSKEDDSVYSTKRRALLDLLLEEHIKNNSITEKDIREEVDTFTFEGHDTTSMGISWSLYLIGLHPEVQKAIHEEIDSIFDHDNDRPITTDDVHNMKYLECVVKEALRLYPPVPVFGRQLNKDIEYKGFKIPKGSTCVIFPFILHRDPTVFPNPEVFDPERFVPENTARRHPFSYVPFSAGPRNCIGQKFALMEAKTVLAAIFRVFTIKSLDPRDRVLFMDNLVLRPAGPLRIQLKLKEE